MKINKLLLFIFKYSTTIFRFIFPDVSVQKYTTCNQLVILERARNYPKGFAKLPEVFISRTDKACCIHCISHEKPKENRKKETKKPFT